MKVKIIGGVSAMSMALATFVSFGITASATDYNASDLHTKYEKGTAPILVGGTDTIKQDGGYTWAVVKTYQSLLKLSYKTTVNASSNLSYAEAENGSKTTVSTLQNGRYKYWKISYSYKHRYDGTRYDYEVTVTPNDPTLTKAPTAKTLTYNGGSQQLVNTGVATNGTVQYKVNSGSWSASIPTATDAGTYTVYYKVVGDANHNDIAEKSVTVTINKANSSYTTEPAAKALTYSGEAQELVTAGTAKFGTVQYKLGDGSYSTAVPTAADAGTYTVYYKVDGNTNYNGIAEKSVTVTISKADASFTTEPAAQSLTWTGKAQELVSAGAANGGTVQYKLGDGEWSTDIPTATAVGSYTVYYKVVGDANHNDTAVNSVTATIGAKAAEATYKKVMDFGGDEYDGEASAWTVTVTPGSTAIESMDVKVNNKPSDGALNNTSTLSGGSVFFGVVVNAAATEVTSMTAVVNGVDVPATLAE